MVGVAMVGKSFAKVAPIKLINLHSKIIIKSSSRKSNRKKRKMKPLNLEKINLFMSKNINKKIFSSAFLYKSFIYFSHLNREVFIFSNRLIGLASCEACEV